MQKIGVFVCWCGSNIAGTVDVHAVAEAMKNVPGVVYATDYQYMCSEVGQQKIRDAIAEYGLTGVVVCSCSPRMHEATFRKTAEKAGLNPYMVEIANIREQCSWIHKDKEVGTEKAITLAKAAVAKVLKNAPLTPAPAPSSSARWSSAAASPASRPRWTSPTRASRWTSSKNRPPSAAAWRNWTRPSRRWTARPASSPRRWWTPPRARRSTSSPTPRSKRSPGFVGNFTVTIRKKARYVDTTKCTGCGACMEKCPSRKGRNEFNMA